MQKRIRDLMHEANQMEGAGKNATTFYPESKFVVEGNAPRETKFQMLAGANNAKEKWWKPE